MVQRGRSESPGTDGSTQWRPRGISFFSSRTVTAWMRALSWQTTADIFRTAMIRLAQTRGDRRVRTERGQGVRVVADNGG